MFIAIRKEQNGSIYIDKNIFSRTKEVEDEQGNVEIVPLFTDEELSQPPYNYKKVEIDDEYKDCVPNDFNEDLTFNVEKYAERNSKKNAQGRIAELKALLTATDYKAIKYAEGIITETEYAEIKALRQSYREEINQLEEKISKL